MGAAGLPAKGSKKPPAAKIKEIGELAGHRIGVIGRTQTNATLLRVILTESGVNPDKVAITQFATNQIAEMARDTAIDAFMAVGPLDSKITTEAIAATAKAGGEPKFLPIEVSEAIAKKHPLYEAEEIPGSIFSPLPARPEDKIDTVSVNHLIVAPKSLSDTTVGGFVRQLFTVRQALAKEVPARRQDREAGYRQGRRVAGASGSGRLYRRHRTHLPGEIQRLSVGRSLVLSGLGSAGAWLRHYLKRDEREQYSEHRDNLLDHHFQGAAGGIRRTN